MQRQIRIKWGDRIRTIIFNNVAELNALQLPACDYIYKNDEEKTPIKEEFLSNTSVRDMHIDGREIACKYTKNTFVYHDTGEVVDEETLKRRKTIITYVSENSNNENSPKSMSNYIPGMNSVIPNITLGVLTSDPSNNRLIVELDKWCRKYTFVYVTDDDQFHYVPRSKYKDITFDADKGLHVIKDNTGEHQVTIKLDLEHIRTRTQSKKTKHNNNNNNNENNNNHHANSKQEAELNDAAIFYYENSDKLLIYPASDSKDKIEKIKSEIFSLQTQLSIDNNIPFSIDSNNIPLRLRGTMTTSENNNIATKVQYSFPNIVIRTFLGKYYGVHFFYNGDPDVAIRILWKKEVTSNLFFPADHFKSCIPAELQELFEVIPEHEGLKLRFKFPEKNPKYTLNHIFNILMKGSEDQRYTYMVNYLKTHKQSDENSNDYNQLFTAPPENESRPDDQTIITAPEYDFPLNLTSSELAEGLNITPEELAQLEQLVSSLDDPIYSQNSSLLFNNNNKRNHSEPIPTGNNKFSKTND